MVRKNYPSISVVIPVYNEEKNLKRLLPSLQRQTYPKNKIEYIILDDGSTDASFALAKKFGAKIIKVVTHDIELNKGIGMYQAKNELVYWLDADMELCSNNYFELLVAPFIDNPEIVGSFTKEFALDGCTKSTINSLLRFISYHPLQQDPLYAFFSPSIKGTVIGEKPNYYLCQFKPGKIPAVGRIMYNRKKLLSTAAGKDKSFIDLESVEIVARAGFEYFAFVPQAKIRHYHADTLSLLIKKRLRNLERDYLPNLEHKYFLWFNPDSPKDIAKIIFWVIYANLFFPELIRGIIRSVWKHDLALLWHPIVAIATTDAILFGFLSQPKGRKFALKLLKRLTIIH